MISWTVTLFQYSIYILPAVLLLCAMVSGDCSCGGGALYNTEVKVKSGEVISRVFNTMSNVHQSGASIIQMLGVRTPLKTCKFLPAIWI